MSMWIEKVRDSLTADVRAELTRLEARVEDQKRALSDPGTVQPLVGAALAAAATGAADELSAALRPLVDRLVGERLRARQRWQLAAAIAVAGGGAVLFWWWHGQEGASLAAQTPPAVVAAPVEEVARAAEEEVRNVVLEERDEGFGLGLAERSDADLAGAVRARLGRCRELAGLPVSFSVKDGWVWLRGEASARGREAAGQALADLGGGVVVVNQIAETEPALADDAGRERDGNAG